MNESYLQYIWKLRRIPIKNLFTTDGEKITIHNFGWHNLDPGPDFFNGQIEIANLKWSGNIEVHVKSSDWYLHKHQNDDSYNNVILHVVYQHDKEVVVNGEIIPTLELQDKIDKEHFEAYCQLTKSPNKIPCSGHKPYDDLAIFQQLTVALIERGNRKAKELEEVFLNYGKSLIHVLHYALFSAFGGRVNKSAFQQLANAISYSILLKESSEQVKIEALLFGIAGFLDDHYPHPYQDSLIREWIFLKHKYNLSSMPVSVWKFGGVRPTSFPTIKIAQLAQFIFEWKYNTNWKNDKPSVIIQNFDSLLSTASSPFWKTHYTFDKTSKRLHKPCMSNRAKQSIVINAVVPYLWFLGTEKKEEAYVQKAVDILEILPSESNKVITDWKDLGVLSKNAADSQSLLEQKNQFCTFRRCLVCKIGYKILAKS